MSVSRPNVLRVKRKRGQDPLQALVLENVPASKRSKQNTPANSRPGTPLRTTPTSGSSYYLLALAGTAELAADAVSSVLAEDVGALKKRKFYLPKSLWEDPAVPDELSDMVKSFLDVNASESQPSHKRRTRNRKESTANPVSVEVPSEYVYDTYHLSEPMTSDNHPQSQIGYVRFFDEENDLYQSDEEDDTAHKVYSDDEDSNAESFYQNDYPSDEDAEGLDPEVILQDGEEAPDDLGNTDELYEDFFQGDESPNFVEDGSESEEEHVVRQRFFPHDDDDEVALHRDKIFGRLQRMIDE